MLRGAEKSATQHLLRLLQRELLEHGAEAVKQLVRPGTLNSHTRPGHVRLGCKLTDLGKVCQDFGRLASGVKRRREGNFDERAHASCDGNRVRHLVCQTRVG